MKKQIDMKRILEVQKEIGTLSKNAKNPFFNSSYLDLNEIIKHVTPILNNHGLVLMQPIDNGDVCTSILDSENGTLIAQSRIKLPEEKNPQKLGSAITYFRRYTLKSLLAIAEGDDDGNLASKPEPKVKVDMTLQIAESNAKVGTTLESMLTTYNMSAEQQTKYESLLKK